MNFPLLKPIKPIKPMKLLTHPRLLEIVSEETKVPYGTAYRVIYSALNHIVRAAKDGYIVRLFHFGSFRMALRKGGRIKDSNEGKRQYAPDYNTLTFAPSHPTKALLTATTAVNQEESHEDN